MKICIQTDVENYGLPRFLVKYIESMGLREKVMEHNDCVFNIASIHSKGFREGTKCTLFLEGDEFLIKGISKDQYARSDILYVLQKNYFSYYPTKAKILKMAVDPEYHYPRDVKKEYDYVFVGRLRGNPVYDDRANKLEELKKSKYKVLVTEGTPETYCDLLSSARIILNILPKTPTGDDVCVNMRIFEGMAIGCMMTDYHPAMDDFGLIKNVHYLPLERFGDISDEEIARVHEAGQKFAYENYSFKDTIKTIAKDIEEFTHEKVC